MYTFPELVDLEGKQFLVVNQSKSYRLDDILLVSLPFRTANPSADAEYALRADDFIVHFRSSKKQLWINSRPGQRSDLVEMISDAYKGYKNQNLTIIWEEESIIIQALVNNTISQFVKEENSGVTQNAHTKKHSIYSPDISFLWDKDKNKTNEEKKR